MAVKYSLDLSLQLNPRYNKACKACGLYLNQLPIFEKATNPQIFWVGLSAVQFYEDKNLLPLSPYTRSGKLIEAIEHPFKDHVNFYKTNLVKCLPLNKGKIRYPSIQEMEKCFPNFETELSTAKPTIVFLLGKQVSSFILQKENTRDFNLSKKFKYRTIFSRNVIFIPIHHPSYVLIYKRKALRKYVDSLQQLVKNNLQFTLKHYDIAS